MQLLALNSEHAPHTGSMATTTFGNKKKHIGFSNL
jgi:hypothetical protein